MLKNKQYHLGILTLILITIGLWIYFETDVPTKEDSTTTAISEVNIYKNSGCQCCSKWGNHLEKKGFKVVEHSVNDLLLFKNEKDIPHNLHACHTALVEGYLVEGHVPAEDIQRMLEKQPDILGIGVNGMPIGSPGMEGNDPEPYTVYSFNGSGNQTVWARH